MRQFGLPEALPDRFDVVQFRSIFRQPLHREPMRAVHKGGAGELAWPGAKSSPSFVRAPEGNGRAERFIRTLKEKLLRVRTFDTIEELQAALQKFKEDYNEEWPIQRHGHRSPNQFRCDAMDKIQAAA